MQPKENMISITEKTLQDLQFPTVLETLSAICNTDIGKQKALQIRMGFRRTTTTLYILAVLS